ncbi:MAG: hypothetical protein A2X59_13100 [Nitrospirae bacterium GWC2_42_7]|nr:MAG: hypothetical protein A2X59_13100 [Nitrospirae bacterium GWC2_42_7]
MRKINLLVILVISIVSFGCAAKVHTPLNQEARENISSCDIYIFLQQQEIYAEIDKSKVSMATGGGLIAALIDSAVDHSRAKKAEASIMPIKNSLVDFDFGNTLKKEIQNSVKSVTWLNVGQINLEGMLTEENSDRCFVNASASAILLVQPSYYFSSDFKSFKIASSVHLLPKSESLQKYKTESDERPADLENAIYKNVLTYQEEVVKEGEKEENLQYWTEDKSIQVKTALSDGIKELARMIAIDINRTDLPDQSSKGEKIELQGIEGNVISRDNPFVIIQLDNGAMFSIKAPDNPSVAQIAD